jgi:FkbM family methyltransferase
MSWPSSRCPPNAAAVRRKVELNSLLNVTVVEAAVSDAEGTASLTVGESKQSLPRSPPCRAGGRRRPHRDDRQARRELDVSPTLIKMDVEGAEEHAVLGGSGTVRADSPS